MLCPICGHKNDQSAKSCGVCTTKLTPVGDLVVHESQESIDQDLLICSYPDCVQHATDSVLQNSTDQPVCEEHYRQFHQFEENQVTPKNIPTSAFGCILLLIVVAFLLLQLRLL